MAIELRQELRLSQQLIMTPQLQMAIKLLQLNRLELQDMINRELEENPALEEVQETAEENTLEQTEVKADTISSTKEVTIDEKFRDDVDWSNYFDEYASPGKIHFESEKKEALNFENFTANKESLDGHLLWQLLMISPTKEEENIGSLVIGNLDKDGFLDASIDEIAKESGFSPEKVTQVLSLMHKFDPPGICARNLSESLLIQAKQLGLNNSIVTKIITNHIKNLENKNYKAIAGDLKISIKEVISAVNIIKGLEPKPGRKFSNEEPVYIIPDIYVHKTE
ncbi:MAG: RNA polymerase sigma-54 factor, partial [Deltaproteobacteria bacterium]|nr:RNA polymerase sigma-54 factor [Deltaproteobacteria bacterium]